MPEKKYTSVSPGVGQLPRTARSGRLILCEEAARDGAQGKTLLLARQRIELFRRTATVLGGHADRCLVSMVGFPGIGPEEVREISETIEGLELGYQQVVCRSIEDELLSGIDLMRGAHAGRVIFVLPTSRSMAAAMLHTSPEVAIERGLNLLRSALDHAAGEVAVDVCLADIAGADPGVVAAGANRLTAEGAEVIMLADTVGQLHLAGHRRLLGGITAELDKKVVIHTHFHNDLGLAHAFNLQALEFGHRMVGSSWLGLGERSGLGHTEELLGTLVTASDDQLSDLGTTRDALGITGWRAWNLPTTARWLAAELGLPRRVTDPFVGSGVNSISTGTPFVAPAVFQPYDAETLLGIAPRIELTHLASNRVVEAVAREHGRVLSREEVSAARTLVKAMAYASGCATVDPSQVFSDPRRSEGACA
jgi:2-isopropylmalate synthase